MEAVFLVCFLVGLSMTAITLLFGVGHVGGVHPGHIGHGAAHGVHGGHGVGHDLLGVVNFTTVMTFVTWFGGVGYVLVRYASLGAAVAVPVAVAAGVGGGAVVTFFIRRVLLSGQTEMRPEAYEMRGTAARVSSTIFPNRAGEVIFTQAGAIRSVAARSLSNEAVPRGTEVVVLKYERGTAYVETWERALGDAPAPPAAIAAPPDAPATG